MTENKGDLISREALLKRVDEERKYLIARGQTGAEHILVHNFRDLIDNAPTVEPEPYFEKAEKDKRIYEQGFEDGQNARPQGEWVTERKYYDDFLKNIIYECSCSVCGARFPFAQIPETTQDAFYSFNYCPACGAKTRTDAD